AVATSGGLQVRVATAETFSRIEFGRGRATARRDGQTLVLTFARAGHPDIRRLPTPPPKWIKCAGARNGGGRLQVVLTRADDADATVGQADGATYVNVFEKPEAPAATAEDGPAVEVAEAEPPRPDPWPPGGVVKMESKVVGGQVQLA